MSDPRPAHDAPNDPLANLNGALALREAAYIMERAEMSRGALDLVIAEIQTKASNLTMSANLNAQLGFIRDAARQYGEAQRKGTAEDVLGTRAYLKTSLERALEALANA